MKYDFSGYATRNDLRCTDNRVIRQDAFADQDNTKVPLVWQHRHDSQDNVLGHALLENRKDGVYAYCSFNNTPSGEAARKIVNHGDIDSLSIYANNLEQRGNNVVHGIIKEVSLVLAGANPGAHIETLAIEHSDGTTEELLDDECYIFPMKGIEFEHSDNKKEEEIKMEEKPKTESGEKTVQDVFDTLNEEQKNVVFALIGAAIQEEGVQHSDDNDYMEEDEMKHNLFDGEDIQANGTLSHSELNSLIAESIEDAKNLKASLKDSIIMHAQDYGVENIEALFPEVKNLDNPPKWISRDMEWVTTVLNGTHHSPFSRIKSQFANITEEDARARGYIKTHEKKEEVFPVLSRTTTPTTVYKKQKLDRDDIIDITDFDVVAWIKAEMRVMLNEELARAILVGDGRSIVSEDKINESNIRPIYTDQGLFTLRKRINSPVNLTNKQFADLVIQSALEARSEYKGSGTPTFFCQPGTITRMLLAQDLNGRRIYESEASLATAMRVSKIVEVPIMEDIAKDGYDLLGIIVNLSDYNVGADKGGDINMFDDFDIDYNQYKYLLETRCSGALTVPYSAIVIEASQVASETDAVVSPMAQTEEVFGTLVKDLQLPNFKTGTKRFSGTSLYYADEDSDLVKNFGPGNFMALEFDAPAGATVEVKMDPSASGSGFVPLDEDMNGVFQITDQYNQKFVVKTTVNGVASIKEYDLRSIRCKME